MALRGKPRLPFYMVGLPAYMHRRDVPGDEVLAVFVDLAVVRAHADRRVATEELGVGQVALDGDGGGRDGLLA